MVSVVGTKAVMECRRNASVLPINWEFAPAGSNNFSYIYTSERMTQRLSSRYKIDTDGSTRWDIVIDSVDLSHAGTYRCEPITKEVLNAPSFSAQLIVLGIRLYILKTILQMLRIINISSTVGSRLSSSIYDFNAITRGVQYV